MVFAEGHVLPESLARVAKSRNIRSDRAPGCWLLPEILLHDVVTMNTIFLCHFQIEVGGSLVQRYVCERSAGKQVESGGDAYGSGSHLVCGRDQREQTQDGRGSYSCPVILTGNGRGNGQTLMLAETFIGQEEKCFVLYDRSTKSGAEFVALE